MSTANHPPRNLAQNARITGRAPDALHPSKHHVRGESDVSETFVTNVRKVGLINPPICRVEDGDLRVVDGVRRVRAAERAAVEEIPVLVYDLTDSEAVEVSLSANLGVWKKQVTAHDEEAALRVLSGGRRRPQKVWETDDALFDAKYSLGLVDDVARLSRVLHDVEGVGNATVVLLADTFESLDAIRSATQEDLEAIDGIGPVKAERIRAALS